MMPGVHRYLESFSPSRLTLTCSATDRVEFTPAVDLRLLHLDPSHERFTPKVTVLMESVRHHVEEEEQEMFPEVRKGMGRKALQELGAEMEKAKKTAPTKPHPKAPDEPPGNLVAGPTAAVIDRIAALVGR